MIIRPPGDDNAELLEVSYSTVEQHLVRLSDSLHGLQKEVVDDKERRRLNAMVEKNGSADNFDVGDYLLWSSIDQRIFNNKALGQWLESFQVTAANSHSFQIRHLVSGATYEAHATRLKYYGDQGLSITRELLEFVAS